jgi:hypothetical protein
MCAPGSAISLELALRTNGIPVLLLRTELAPVALRTVCDRLRRPVICDLQPPALLFDKPRTLALDARELLANGNWLRGIYSSAIIAGASGICPGPVEVVGPVENEVIGPAFLLPRVPAVV